MAYFANGTEGLYLDEQCCGCLYGLDEEVLCPVSAVQNIYNYDQIGNDKLREAMDLLIDKKGICRMKKAILAAGIKFDFSEKDQMQLL